MTPLVAGTLAGAFHVISGPDHLVAVTPLAVRQPAQAVRVGALWGAGHAVGAGLLGAIGVLAKSYLDVDFLSSWAEFLVGAVLCAVGIWAIVQTRKLLIHHHHHAHDGEVDAVAEHEHEHLHIGDDKKHLHHGTSFGVGVLHGAAGTGYLLGVLPSLALPPLSAAVYLISYGLAAVGAMAAFSAGLGLLGKRLRPAWLRHFLMGS